MDFYFHIIKNREKHMMILNIDTGEKNMYILYYLSFSSSQPHIYIARRATVNIGIHYCIPLTFKNTILIAIIFYTLSQVHTTSIYQCILPPNHLAHPNPFDYELFRWQLEII